MPSTWVAAAGGRTWIAGEAEMAAPLTQNELTETVPGSGSVVLSMDFGNIDEVMAGDLVASCTVGISPTTSPALTAGSVSVSGGYRAYASFTGGAPGTYTVTWTPTLVSGQTLPPRYGTLVLQ